MSELVIANKQDIVDIADNLRSASGTSEEMSLATMAATASDIAKNVVRSVNGVTPDENGNVAILDVATALNRSTTVNAADANYTTYMARGVSLNSSETTPTINGTIAWTYE